MSGHPFVHLWVFSLSFDEGKGKIAFYGADVNWMWKFTMVNQYCKWLILSIPPSLQKSSSIFLVGTDFRRRFAPSVFNPVGPLSQEGILHNPRQRFETVWSLSEQEKTTERTTHQSKRRSLTAKKMATKSLKTRYVSIAISLKWKLATMRLWIAILEGFLKSLKYIFVGQIWSRNFHYQGARAR